MTRFLTGALDAVSAAVLADVLLFIAGVSAGALGAAMWDIYRASCDEQSVEGANQITMTEEVDEWPSKRSWTPAKSRRFSE